MVFYFLVGVDMARMAELLYKRQGKVPEEPSAGPLKSVSTPKFTVLRYEKPTDNINKKNKNENIGENRGR